MHYKTYYFPASLLSLNPGIYAPKSYLKAGSYSRSKANPVNSYCRKYSFSLIPVLLLTIFSFRMKL